MLWLYFEGRHVPLRQGEMTFGRSPYCSIAVDDPAVSREHCAIVVTGERATLQDLSSRNGTSLNGTKLSHSATLCSGDEISLGRCVLRIVEGQRLSEDDGSENSWVDTKESLQQRRQEQSGLDRATIGLIPAPTLRPSREDP